MWSNRYKEGCKAAGLTPRSELEKFSGGSIVIAGNTFDNFTRRLTDEELEAIMKTSGEYNNVNELILPYNTLTSKGALSVVRALKAGMDSLMTIDLSHNGIGGDFAIALAECLKTNGTVTNVNLQGNPLTGQCGPALREMLEVNRSLLRLCLFNTDLDMKSLTDICFGMRSNNTLTSLNIGKPLLHNPDDIFYVIHHLSLFLHTNTSLEELDLSHFGIIDSNLQTLLPSLSSSAVVIFSLRGNKLSQDGGALLGRLLERKQDFIALDVSANRLRDVGAVAVAASVKVHTHLQALYMANNTIGEKGIVALADALRSCLCLKAFTLWGNDFHGESVRAMYEINDRLKQLDEIDFEMYLVDGEPSMYRT